MASAEGSSFESAVAKALKDCPPGTVCLAAVSGGADSVAMLVALAGIRGMGNGEWGSGIGGQGAAFDLRCIHVEHGIRPEAESRGDADFVRGLCEKLRVPCRVVSVPPGKIVAMAKKRGLGIEAAARLYRRRAFFREAARLDEARLDAAGSEAASSAPARVLTAHTADDALETTLMRILRGAGPSGLAAMPASRGRLLRPLLALSRRDVLRYLAEKNISWREDSTNTDTAFLRNRIRHRLIPLLNETFPQWHGALASLAETQFLAANFIEHEARQRVTWEWGSENGEWGMGNGDQGQKARRGVLFPFPAVSLLTVNFFSPSRPSFGRRPCFKA
ncbi:MAG: tRNA lysidine(34) synthetase TilS [Treponema sp.]|nr:tRNA lysidine(34) synthetase TilS [Treponema sp.]